jgi:NusA N-terminal domain.
MVCNEIVEILKQLERERGIPYAELVATLEGAFANAYRKQMHLPHSARVYAKFTPDQPGCFRIFVEKEVVGVVTDDSVQISLEEAQKLNPALEVGDTVQIEASIEQFGRVAVQNAFPSADPAIARVGARTRLARAECQHWRCDYCAD